MNDLEVMIKLLKLIYYNLIKYLKQISEKLGLCKIKNRQWSLFKTSAKLGKGLEEGFTW